MLRFPEINNVKEPPQKKMSMEEYIAFCDFCLRNNPSITPESCMERDSGEASIKKPFKI